MMDDTTTANIAETIRDTFENLLDVEIVQTPEAVDLNTTLLLSVPKGRNVQDMSDVLRDTITATRPIRRKGTAQLATLDSLIDWANRFKGPTSTLFADPNKANPSLTCIANYHAEGEVEETGPLGDTKAAYGDHRGHYEFPLSKEWQKWKAVDGTPLERDELGYLFEDNAKDLADPTPYLIDRSGDAPEDWEKGLASIASQIGGRFGSTQELMALSREFRVHETSSLVTKTDRTTGAGTIQFTNEHNTPDGAPISIPNLFLICIPVFESGHLYRLPVRLQYRTAGGSLRFTITLYDPDKAIDDAFQGACATAQEQTDLPLFLGTPET